MLWWVSPRKIFHKRCVIGCMVGSQTSKYWNQRVDCLFFAPPDTPVPASSEPEITAAPGRALVEGDRINSPASLDSPDLLAGDASLSIMRVDSATPAAATSVSAVSVLQSASSVISGALAFALRQGAGGEDAGMVISGGSGSIGGDEGMGCGLESSSNIEVTDDWRAVVALHSRRSTAAQAARSGAMAQQSGAPGALGSSAPAEQQLTKAKVELIFGRALDTYLFIICYFYKHLEL